MEVIYIGRRQTVESIIDAPLQEYIKIIGLSIIYRVHLEVCKELFHIMKEGILKIFQLLDVVFFLEIAFLSFVR